ncbi:unnamed protein product [Rotaria magnacalcarata]|uniref:HAT C-terminal dimerisation domain-containing protein n=3 Tax=Rotaria magnacalcarata TaxID=392030 RepID=A0A819U0Y0_9BILA|nr:unnamed protein product [Rotaria magnacalcarata]CAF2112477.1 unnamed protein product [Rotaria magnacalcarata]CAF3771648.1 unnamed protein product [Rotaria magnacalcarata]CAF4083988.1 unnamed protein product [Rotaria magnacalcarata]
MVTFPHIPWSILRDPVAGMFDLGLKDLCLMLKSDIQLLNDGVQVLEPMLKQLKPKNMIDLYFEVLPFEQAFSSILSLLIGAMAIPVSYTTTERTFSKMKLIKTVARNNMSDNRLSDLSLLASF